MTHLKMVGGQSTISYTIEKLYFLLHSRSLIIEDCDSLPITLWIVASIWSGRWLHGVPDGTVSLTTGQTSARDSPRPLGLLPSSLPVKNQNQINLDVIGVLRAIAQSIRSSFWSTFFYAGCIYDGPGKHCFLNN